MHNWKFHILVITGLIAGVSAVFYYGGALEPQSQNPVNTPIEQPAPAKPVNRITVVEANWGLNCTDVVERRIKRLEPKLQMAGPEEYEELMNEMPTMPTRGGVTEIVAGACNGEEACEIKADRNSFGDERISGCLQDLEVHYRCFAIDQRRMVTASFSDTLTIDCSSVDQ